MTVCKQNVNAKGASKYIKGRGRRIDQHVLLPFPGKGWCPQQPPTVDDQKKKQTQITTHWKSESWLLCFTAHPPSNPGCKPAQPLKAALAACSLLAPGMHGSWMACSQCSFAAGGGSSWQKVTVQMGIKFSLMFIICQKRIILCQSGLEELLLRSLQKFLFDKMEVALFQLHMWVYFLKLGRGARPQWNLL